jgi:peptidyl-dipeptidase A
VADLAPRSANERALEEFIRGHVAEIEPLIRASNQAAWRVNLTGDAGDQEESARLESRLRKVYARREPLERLLAIERAGEVNDPLLQRQLTVMILSHRAHQIPPDALERIVRMEKALESRFNSFRAKSQGRSVPDNELRRVLRESDDSEERREAWEASKQIGAEVRDELLELVRLRNQAARDQGFPNYYAMMLELDELDETRLFAMLDELASATEPLFERYRGELDRRLAARFGIAPSAVRPWHFADPFFQQAPAAEVNLDRWFAERDLVQLTRDYFRAVGFDIDDLIARSDLYERPGKCQHAFCMTMDRGPDIRVLCNVRPNEVWMGTLLHEFGHAVYDQCLDSTLPFLLRTHAHILTTEASAMLLGRLSKNAAWLERYAGVPADEARSMQAGTEAAIRRQLLVQVRWNLVMCAMERALYRDPDQDLDTLWWDLVEKYQRVRRPDGRRGPDWASKIHFSVAPVYYQNYLLGEIMASQLQRALLREFAGESEPWARYVESPRTGEWLRERLYRSGRRFEWRETVRRATGEPFGVAALVADLGDSGA